jgi:nickel-dependent lactate racemase
MRADVKSVLFGADLSRWTPTEIEYGTGTLPVRVPPGCEILWMRETAGLPDPERAIRASLAAPIDAPPLREIVRGKGKSPSTLSACIAVSDITRPVPYKGKEGILLPLLSELAGAGVRPENVLLLVGTGTHRPSTRDEKIAMFGEETVATCRIEDHDCDADAALVSVGRTRGGTDVRINRSFAEADVRIATGLVESHFMAGVSGGRKAICPALVGRDTIERFHGAAFLESPLAANLVLAGNPCHEEAVEIARMARVDFAVNAVLDRSLRLIGITAGDLERSHESAVELVRSVAAIPLDGEFDVVLTHGGYVGINHYQVAKAAVNALPAVREGGFVVLLACERDEDPVGPETYRTLLHLLKLQGPDGYLAALLSPAWRFTKDQWEPQMWAKALRKVGEEGLIYCSARLPARARSVIPSAVGWDFLPDGAGLDERNAAATMLQNALLFAVLHPKWGGAAPRTAFIPEGPYAVPVPRTSVSNG